MNIETLNAQFSIAGCVNFELGGGNLPIAVVRNSCADATISLYGAQVMSFCPKGEREVLWTSPLAEFEVGKAIRGGIPLCFPWFGPDAAKTGKPSHGFARLSTWRVISTEAVSSSETKLVFGLSDNEYTHTLWDGKFEAQLTVHVGTKLSVCLSVTSTDSKTLTVTDALHSYFNLSDIDAIEVEGLHNTPFLEVAESAPSSVQQEPILRVEQEVNRRYVNHTQKCLIADRGWNRTIAVEKMGSTSTVVWNPWVETSKSMKDIPAGGYKNFICIEAANILDDRIVLEPGSSHSLTTTIYLV